MKTEKEMEREISIYIDNLILNSKFEDWDNPNKEMIKGNIHINISSLDYLFSIYVRDPNHNTGGKVISIEVGSYSYSRDTYKWWDIKSRIKRIEIARKREEILNFFSKKSMNETTKRVYNLLPVKEQRKEKLKEILK